MAVETRYLLFYCRIKVASTLDFNSSNYRKQVSQGGSLLTILSLLVATIKYVQSSVYKLTKLVML